MSNLQRFVAGEDTTLVGAVDDAIKTMAVVEACYESSATTAIPAIHGASDDRRAPAFLALRPGRVRLDRRLDGGAAARLPARDAAARDGGRGIDASVAVQARQTLEETRWLLALADRHPFIAGVVGWVDLQVDGRDAELERVCAGTRGSSASATSCRRAGRLPASPGVPPRHRAARAVRADLRHPHLRATSAGGRRSSRARFPRQRFVLDHLGKPDIRGERIRPSGGATSRAGGACPTSGASCRGW